MSKKKTPNGAGLMSGLAAAVGIKQPMQEMPAPLDAGYVKPPSRRGRAGILTYHDPAVAQQLKLLAVREETTQQKLVAEALNMVFAKYGMSQIA